MSPRQIDDACERAVERHDARFLDGGPEWIDEDDTDLNSVSGFEEDKPEFDEDLCFGGMR